MKQKQSNILEPVNSVACLTSGGLDSVVLLFYLKKQYKYIYPIYIKTGLNYETAEIYHLKKIIDHDNREEFKPLTILNFDVRDLYTNHWGINGTNIPGYDSNDESVYLPGRNIILFSKLGVWCYLNNINNIACGHLKGNPFADASENFIELMEKCLSSGLNFDINIIRPFINNEKFEIINLLKNIPLETSFSCINPKLNSKGVYIHCGQCNKCAERIKAFQKASIIDKTIYYTSIDTCTQK